MNRKIVLVLFISAAMFFLASCDSTRNLSLELNENPTTGYRWEYVVEGDVDVVTDKYVAAEKEPLTVGSGGQRYFEFEAANKEESCSVKLYYRRSWEEFPSAADYTYVYDGKSWKQK